MLLLLLVMVMGCATATTENVEAISDSYERIVFDDGITLEESKVIAQKQLIRKNVIDIYDFSKPQAALDVTDLPNHQDYWFVFFEETRPGNIPFIFMIVINKETGRVKFADDYNEGNQWILEAALLH